jgi:hypothetical protein
MYFWSETRERNMAKKCNYDLYEIFNEPNIGNYIKVKRLAGTGHLVRVDSDRASVDSALGAYEQ